jgi:hypothetical protein
MVAFSTWLAALAATQILFDYYLLLSFSTTAAKKSRSSIACLPTGFGRAPKSIITILLTEQRYRLSY